MRPYPHLLIECGTLPSVNAQNVIGKPLVVYIDGERRQIGTIERAVFQDGKLYIASIIEIKEKDPK